MLLMHKRVVFKLVNVLVILEENKLTINNFQKHFYKIKALDHDIILFCNMSSLI